MNGNRNIQLTRRIGTVLAEGRSVSCTQSVFIAYKQAVVILFYLGYVW